MKKLFLLFAVYTLLFNCKNNENSYKIEQSIVQQDYFNNPILAGWYPDPSITDDGKGNYYMVCSTFAYYPGIPIFHSKDLVNWKQIGNVLDRPEQLDLEGFGVSRGIFAPDISYNDGIFYVTSTLVDGKGNFVVTTRDPAGNWSSPVWLPEVSGIDPGLFFDDEKAYLVYNSDAPDNKPLYEGHRTIRLIEFDKDSLKTIRENRIIVNGGVDISEKPIWAEGPRIYKLNGYYYLMTAEGGTAVNHSEVIYRTKNIDSSFVPYKNNPILTQRNLDPDRENPITSAGHADIVQHPNGEWYGVFLACRDYGNNNYNTGRETFLAPVKWVDNWPVFDLKGEKIKYQYTLPEGVEINHDLFPLNGNFTFKDEFDKDTLNFNWMFLRTVNDKWYSLSDDKLVLKTRPETISGKSNPSFIGHRQQHLKCEASVSMSFKPVSESEQAGLVAFIDEDNYYYINVSSKDNQPIVQLIKGLKGDNKGEVIASKQISLVRDNIQLKIQADKDIYNFYYKNEESWKTLAEKLSAEYLSPTYDGLDFVGVTFALYTTSNNKQSDNKAFFNWFEYVGNDDVFN